MIVARETKREKVGMAGIEVGDSVGRRRAGQKKGDRGREAVGRRRDPHQKQRDRGEIDDAKSRGGRAQKKE